MACSIVARKLGVPIARVEGGICSGDWSMPEEINRMVTNSITTRFFTTSAKANESLRRAGVADERILFVGNTMIDTLLTQMPGLQPPDFWAALDFRPGQYSVVTLHRPANVDGEQQLLRCLAGGLSRASAYREESAGTGRPATVIVGTNELIGTAPAKLGSALARLMAEKWKKGGIPEMWDGRAAERIVVELQRLLG
jgi:UDP-N-acetylglucosamine 2-epimerase